MASGLTIGMREMIVEEQTRQHGRFVAAASLEDYLDKLIARAEVLSDLEAGRCRGFVAYYCNNTETRQAYITLVLVDPRDRGAGVAKKLVDGVLAIARERGFTSCRLEVGIDNMAARQLYSSLGFVEIEHRGEKLLLEARL